MARIPTSIKFLWALIALHFGVEAGFLGTESEQMRPESRNRTMNTSQVQAVVNKAMVEVDTGSTDQSSNAFEWMENKQTPAALVGAAALTSFFELKGNLIPAMGDSKLVRLMKSMVAVLLLASFACEISCVYVCTVTSTMLLGNANRKGNVTLNTFDSSPIGMLHRELELEYLTIRISFFQGILNWLIAIAVQMGLPPFTHAEFEGMSETARSLARISLRWHTAAASATASLVMGMIAYYHNANENLFFGNYGSMVWRWCYLSFKRYMACWPPRVSPMISAIFMLVSLVNAAIAVVSTTKMSLIEWQKMRLKVSKSIQSLREPIAR